MQNWLSVIEKNYAIFYVKIGRITLLLARQKRKLFLESKHKPYQPVNELRRLQNLLMINYFADDCLGWQSETIFQEETYYLDAFQPENPLWQNIKSRREKNFALPVVTGIQQTGRESFIPTNALCIRVEMDVNIFGIFQTHSTGQVIALELLILRRYSWYEGHIRSGGERILHRCEGNVDTLRHQPILSQTLPEIHRPRNVLHQDCAFCHRARSTTRFQTSERQVRVQNSSPAQNPNLNSIKNMWVLL